MLGMMVTKKSGRSGEPSVSSTGSGPDGRFLVTASISFNLILSWKFSLSPSITIVLSGILKRHLGSFRFSDSSLSCFHGLD